MHIECLRENLHKAVISTDRVTDKNLPLPVLSTILLDASSDKNSLIIRATNLEVSVEYKIPAKIIKKGECAVSGDLLNRFIQNIESNTNIELKNTDSGLSISTEKVSSTIKTTATDDFPKIPAINKEESEQIISVSSMDFVDSIERVSYAAALSEIKPEISSVFISKDDEGLSFTATDSFRLARKVLAEDRFKKTKGDELSVIVPIKNVFEIKRIFDGLTEDIELHLNKNKLVIISKDIYFTSRVIDGSFPDLSQILRQKTETEIISLRSDLLRLLKLANIFSDKFNRVGFNIVSEDKLCEIYSKSQEVGEEVSSLDATINGEDVKIEFNVKYLLDFFNSVDSDSVSISFAGPGRPVIMRGVDDKTLTYLVSPLNS